MRDHRGDIGIDFEKVSCTRGKLWLARVSFVPLIVAVYY